MAEMQELQKIIADIRTKRGFVTDPLKIHILLTEEVGEIAAELKRLWSKNYEAFDAERLQEELADAFVCLSALANAFEIDLETAVQQKFIEKDSGRQWKTALTDSQKL